MHFKASYVTETRAAAIDARAINWLGLIAALTVYCYSPPVRAMEDTS